MGLSGRYCAEYTGTILSLLHMTINGLQKYANCAVDNIFGLCYIQSNIGYVLQVISWSFGCVYDIPSKKRVRQISILDICRICVYGPGIDVNAKMWSNIQKGVYRIVWMTTGPVNV